jgi:hypothetical protein
MDGDIKDIVLARLEKRLKDKDEEIRALKERLGGYENSDRLKALEEKTERLQDDVRETQIALSEVMKKVGGLEAAIVGLAASEEEDGDETVGLSDPDLALDGQSVPLPPVMYDSGVGAAVPDDGEKEKKDAMRFFRMSKNA